ncbi:MAG: hypothetical protein WAO58_12610 [Fimbriimonadaceae bacterium]
MREVELGVPTGDVSGQIESLAALAGLRIRLRGTLAAHLGCVHWHFGKPPEKGTLEVTWWPSQSRLWLKVHPMRDAVWIPGAIDLFEQRFGNAL